MLRKEYFALFMCFSVLTLRTSAQTVKGNEASPPSKSTISSVPNQNSIETRVELYLRNAYAWGPAFEVKVGPPKSSPIPDLLALSVTVTMSGQSDTAIVYADRNGKFIVRGEMLDMSIDPFAETRSKLSAKDSPSLGPQDAKVTLIEFADFECPSCRQLDLILRNLIVAHPEIRLVYKNFPLSDLHPWAMTAAIAGQCAYQQQPDVFWKFHNSIFDAQDLITPSNAWDKMIDVATQHGLDKDTFRTCMSDPETTKQIEKTQAEGRALKITATPTTFINGRRVVGADETLIQQYIQYGFALK